MKRIVIYTLLIMFLISCGDQELGTPKPRMYPKVDYPERNTVNFDESYCSMSFEYPDYFTVVQDVQKRNSKPVDPCWFDLESVSLNSQLHCSYIPIKNRAHFDKLVQDAFKITSKHNQKANYRKEQLIENKEDRVYGLLFEHEGPVASPLQFFVTDSISNFFRGSLYFKSTVNPDSIAPVYKFVKGDVMKMIETFKWD